MNKNKKPYLIRRKQPGENQEIVNLFGWGLLGFLLIYLLYSSVMVFSSDEPKTTTTTKPSNVLTTTTLPVAVTAQKNLKIIGSNVNVRSAPEIEQGNVIIRVAKDTILTLVAEENGWYHVKLQDKRDGYIKVDPTIAKVEEIASSE